MDKLPPTPETDAQCYGNGTHPYVPTDFARKLERERNEMRDAIREAHTALLRVSECRIFYAESMDIDSYTQEDCDKALAKLQPFLK
jgi:hypothetical protein